MNKTHSDKTTRIVMDDLIVSYHELDANVAKAKQAYESNRAILEVRDVCIVPVRNEKAKR